MNIDLLQKICKKHSRSYFNDLIKELHNPLFELNQEYVTTCIYNYNIDFGCSVSKEYMKTETLNEIQSKIYTNTIIEYKKLIERTTYNYYYKNLQ